MATNSIFDSAEHQISQDLKQKPHDMQAVYHELNTATECETPKGTSEELHQLNNHLHKQGLLPHLDIVQDPKSAEHFSTRPYDKESLTDVPATTKPVPKDERASLIKSALKLDHVPVTKSNIKDVNTVIKGESSWKPIDQNNWDINAKEGHPSEGLMQEIEPTFKEFAARGHRSDINDPLSNVASGINNIEKTYGSLNRAPGVVSERDGGPYIGYM